MNLRRSESRGESLDEFGKMVLCYNRMLWRVLGLPLWDGYQGGLQCEASK